MRCSQGMEEQFQFDREDDASCWFESRVQNRTLESLLLFLRKKAGFICLTAEPGMGKSVLARALAQAHVAEGGRAVLADGRNLCFGRLLGDVLRAAGLTPSTEPPGGSAAALRMLYEAGELGSDVALVVDAAQALKDSTLKALAYLANPWQPGCSAVQLVLVGRPELLDRLDGPDLAPLGRLCGSRAELRPMDRREAEAYLRWKHGSAPEGGQAFTARARHRLADLSRGVPGLLDMLAEAAKASGEASGRFPVTCGMVRQAVGCLPGHAPFPLPVGKAVALAAALLLLVSAGVWWARQDLVSGLERLAGGLLGQASAVVERLEAPWIAGAPSPVWADVETHAAGAIPGMAVVRAPAVPGAGCEPGGACRRVIVAPGDTLLGLCRKVYGRADKMSVQAVLTANPGIANPDTIEVGQIIHFPPESRAVAGESARTGV